MSVQGNDFDGLSHIKIITLFSKITIAIRNSAKDTWPPGRFETILYGPVMKWNKSTGIGLTILDKWGFLCFPTEDYIELDWLL